MRNSLLAAGAIALAVALGGCGDDDDSGAGGSDSKGGTATAPALDTVLDCLMVGGLKAKDQSSSTGERIGIDYDGGRLLVLFEGSVEDAETTASVAEANGDTVIRKGSVVITIPPDPTAEADRNKVEECVAP